MLKYRRKEEGLKTRRRIKKKARSIEDEIPCDYFPTGSTNLNLALSGMHDRGWARGRTDNIVGDRSAGKTLLALEALANFYYHIPYIKSDIWKSGKKPIVVLNNSEGVMDFDIVKMYELEFYQSLVMLRSPHIQHAGKDFLSRAKNLKKNEALLYVMDTWDFFRSKEQLQRFDTSLDGDGTVESSYDGEKQKWAPGFFSKIAELVNENKTDATLIIVSQIRKTMTNKPFQKENYRTGGKAFDHAMHQEVWIREKQKLDATKHGESRVYSFEIAAKVEKNKTAKPYRTANFTILYDYGIDDVVSLIKYVIGKPSTRSPKNWDGQRFTSIRDVALYIEENNYEAKIKKEAKKKFRKVERAFEREVASRKKRWNSPITG